MSALNLETLEKAYARREGRELSPERARFRNVATMAKFIVACDRLIDEAAEARISAPGVVEIREWAEHAILEQCERARDSIAAKVGASGTAVAA